MIFLKLNFQEPVAFFVKQRQIKPGPRHVAKLSYSWFSCEVINFQNKKKVINLSEVLVSSNNPL